jgi:hypothetical protein
MRLKNQIKRCSIDGCDHNIKGHGYCNKHYQRFIKTGDPLLVRTKKKYDTCTIEGCKDKFLAKGMCSRHYKINKTYGDPLHISFPEICTIEGCSKPYAQNGYCAMHDARKRRWGDTYVVKYKYYNSFEECFNDNVEKEDCWLWKGIKRKGYGWMCVKQERIASHRYSYLKYVGPIDDGLFVCHKCDTRNCVNPSHLFLGTNTDNMQDMLKKNRGRWRAKNGNT